MEPITLPGILDSLGPIASYVKDAAAAAGLDKKAAYRLRLAIDEIATNVIVHGYEESGTQGDVVIKADIDEGFLSISIEDNAPQFDPMAAELVEEEELSKPLESRPIGGLGVYLAIQGVDKFHYERTGDRNRNVFVMNRPPSS